MPPKRNIKPNKTKPPQLPQLNSENNSAEAIEAELKFDQEVLWCINQFEKIINSGKINDAKKHESMKAIMTLKKPNVTKIEKIQLMKSYFKDYKTKMAQHEEEVKKAENSLNFENTENKSSGKFLKKKVESTTEPSNGFFFNFNRNDDNNDLSSDKLNESVNKLSLT